MKWLPEEKRKPFLAVVVVTLALLGLISVGLIRSQYAQLSGVKATLQTATQQLQTMQKNIQTGEVTTKQLEAATALLAQAEENMASGDLYSWAYNLLRLFKQQYKVEIPEMGHPVEGEVYLISGFPYRQMRLIIAGKAYYHDIGKFVAGIENNYPYLRLTDVKIEPAEGEKLSFKMDLLALIKPDAR